MKKELVCALVALFGASTSYAKEASFAQVIEANPCTVKYTVTLTRNESIYDAEKWDRIMRDAQMLSSRSGATPEDAIQKILETLQMLVATQTSEDGIQGRLTLSLSDSDRVCNCDDDCGCRIDRSPQSETACTQECTSKSICNQKCAQAVGK